MCQIQRHWNEKYGKFLTEQFVGWLLAHDCLPENVGFWNELMPELQMWREDIQFRPYWKSGWGAQPLTPDVLVSAHTRPGETVLWIVNTARQAQTARVGLNLRQLGFDGANPVRVFDAETGDDYALHDDSLSIDLPARMWRAVRIVQPRALRGSQTFVAHFEKEVAADESLGDPYPRGLEVLPVVEGGKTGRGATLGRSLTFSTRHNLKAQAGSLEFQLRSNENTSGNLLDFGGVKFSLTKGKLRVYELQNDKNVMVGETDWVVNAVAPETAPWHAVRVSWQGLNLQAFVDGRLLFDATLQRNLPISSMARGLDLQGGRDSRIVPSRVTLGPLAGAMIDDLVMTSGA
jgi:hypothetical protein